MQHKLIMVIMSLVSVLLVGCGGEVLTWEKTFGGSNYDEARSVQQTSDGGYIVAGTTASFGTGGRDFWLIKTDALGNELWNKTFGGSDWDRAYSVQQTSDGGYIVAGWTRSFGAGKYDFWLVKTDALGNELWNKTYGGVEDDFAFSVQQTSDGGYIVVGESESSGDPDGDVLLVKTDAQGNELWNKVFGGSEMERAYSVQQTSDGGYIMAGETWSFSVFAGDVWLIKTDALGNELWNQTFSGSETDRARSVQQTSDGGYILAGETGFEDGNDEGDLWLIKTDSLGNELWNKTFGGSHDDSAFSVQQVSDGGYIVAGETNSIGAGQHDFWLIKTDALGNELWNKTFGGSGWDSAYSVQQASYGGYIVAGGTESFGSGGLDFLLIKTDANGSVQ